MKPRTSLILSCAILLASCSRDRTVSERRSSPKLDVLPIAIRVAQRTTTPIPGSKGALVLTIDDITRGQVMTSLAKEDGAPLLGATSMKAGQSTSFALGSDQYRLTLAKLDNALIGQDYASFEIDLLSAGMSEDEKIDRLIDLVGALRGATFLRNGSEYSAADAASHLRTKRKAAGDDIEDAMGFIDHLATKSSTSGEDYKIRLEDGSILRLADFLRARLAEMERPPER